MINHIKLLDLGSPKQTKDTINLLIDLYNAADTDLRDIANNANSNAASALVVSNTADKIATEAKQIAQDAYNIAATKTGTQVFENGEFISEFNADNKANTKYVDTKIAELADNINIENNVLYKDTIEVTDTINPFDNYYTKGEIDTSINLILNDINNTINKHQLIHDENSEISISDKSFSTISELYLFMLNYPNNTFSADIGAFSNNNVKNLLGNPNGFANYTACHIRRISKDYGNDQRGGGIFECIAVGEFIGKIASGYIFSANQSNVAYFTGWSILK